MKNIEFKQMLFKGAFSVMACDGEVHETEIAEMKEMLSNSPYFEGLDHVTELKAAFDDVKINGSKSIERFLKTLGDTDLNERQEFQLIEVLCRIVMADSKVDDSELHFLHNVKTKLKKFTDEKIIINFPRHVDLLIDIGHFEGQSLREGLEDIDFGELNNLTIND